MSKKIKLTMKCPACEKEITVQAKKPSLTSPAITAFDCVPGCASHGFLRVEKVSGERSVNYKFIRFTTSARGAEEYNLREYRKKLVRVAELKNLATADKLSERMAFELKKLEEELELNYDYKTKQNANNGDNKGVIECNQ